MKKLDGFSLVDLINKYADNSSYVGCIVMSRNSRRKYIKDALSVYRDLDVLKIFDNKVHFKNKSVIHLCIAADRHVGMMYDDILVDKEIKDKDLLRMMELADKDLNTTTDLGEFEPSSIPLSYMLGGIGRD